MSKKYHVWSRTDDEFIKANAPYVTDDEGARQLSVILKEQITSYQFRNRRVQLGIEKVRGRHGTSGLKKDRTKGAIAATEFLNPQIPLEGKSGGAPIVGNSNSPNSPVVDIYTTLGIPEVVYGGKEEEIKWEPQKDASPAIQAKSEEDSNYVGF